MIFRGEGGRGLLGDTLAARGAAIEYAACYRRGLPQGDATLLREAWAHNELHAIVVTSSEGLRNLVLLVGASTQKCLKETPLFVPHPRIERTAHECGFSGVVLTGQGDEQIVLGLTQWFAGRH